MPIKIKSECSKKKKKTSEDKRMSLQFFHLIGAFYFDPKGQLCLILPQVFWF